MATCEYCGKEIERKSHKKGKVRKFCSNACYQASRNPADYQLTTCRYCGKVFREKRYGLNLYCSNRCRGSALSEESAMAKAEYEALDKEEKEHREAILTELREVLTIAENLRFRLEHEKKCAVNGSLLNTRRKYVVAQNVPRSETIFCMTTETQGTESQIKT